MNEIKDATKLRVGDMFAANGFVHEIDSLVYNPLSQRVAVFTNYETAEGRRHDAFSFSAFERVQTVDLEV
ncbi:hypothetical protein ADZZY_91 [Mycobacterium phage Adzzy]|uniref:hypothetical protein n=1 Tax=Mycobacterium phage Adzzy TaxID=1383059 RepID=UPI0003882027|nr:hypothetical protein ADZZY_91 [Mycobacterium phage Adzzy]AGT14339.1 hypothetical protein ADZZY_91 [Mycobacterium phage Adzzy]